MQHNMQRGGHFEQFGDRIHEQVSQQCAVSMFRQNASLLLLQIIQGPQDFFTLPFFFLLGGGGGGGGCSVERATRARQPIVTNLF